jgi:hypothetical protein
MADYEPVTDGFAIPRRIKATLPGPDKQKDSMEIKLGSATVKEFSQQQRELMFVPQVRDKERAEHLYEYHNGQWVPEY